MNEAGKGKKMKGARNTRDAKAKKAKAQEVRKGKKDTAVGNADQGSE